MPAIKKRIVNLSSWSRRNLWPLASGDLAVRPGLREMYDTGADVVHAGFSVRSDLTSEMFHYLVIEDSTGDLQVHILDEFFTKIVEFAWSDDATLTGPVTRAVVNGNMVIASPGLPPLRGRIGEMLYFAKKRTNSINPDLTTQPLPRGIVTGWANRCVYAEGNTIQFSDAGDPLSIVSINFVNPEGEYIYGLHESGAGSLIIVTTTGVYELSREAAARGQVVLGIIRKVCDYAAPGYGCSAVSRGRVWGTTRRGVRLVDTPDPFEILMAEPRVAATSFPAVAFDNFQLSTVYTGADGIVLSLDGAQLACLFDEATQSFSWWSASSALESDSGFDVVGTLFDYDGSLLLLVGGGILKPVGNYDTGDGTVVGSVVGRIPTHPGESLTIRSVEIAGDGPGSAYCSVGGTNKTEAIPQAGVVAGSGVIGTATWLQAPVRSRAFNWANRTDDHSVEFGVTVPMSRLDLSAAVQMGGVERERDSN